MVREQKVKGMEKKRMTILSRNNSFELAFRQVLIVSVFKKYFGGPSFREGYFRKRGLIDKQPVEPVGFLFIILILVLDLAIVVFRGPFFPFVQVSDIGRIEE